MKTLPAAPPRSLAALLAAAALLSAVHEAAANLGSARVSEAVQEVSLQPEGAAPRPAAVGDVLRGSSVLSTGRSSRAELEFPDNTLMRLGANTVFSLAGGSRAVELREGSALIQTAPGRGGVNIRSGTVVAGISGSLGLFSISPPPRGAARRDGQRVVKLISVHGTMHLSYGGQTYELQPFEMIFFHVDREGNMVGEPVIRSIDARRLVKSSRLINGFPGSVKISQEQILAELNRQIEEKRSRRWIAVTTDTEKSTTGLFRRNTTDLGPLMFPPFNRDNGNFIQGSPQ